MLHRDQMRTAGDDKRTVQAEKKSLNNWLRDVNEREEKQKKKLFPDDCGLPSTSHKSSAWSIFVLETLLH